MENLGIMENFWRKKKIFLTGHTGFKGSWLSMWLSHMGAHVTGYSLRPPTEPSLFNICNIENKIESSIIGDIRDLNKLVDSVQKSKPDIVIHMAAQPLVRLSYDEPVETYSVNVMGTVNILEAVRQTNGIKAVINVTTDKCYENREWLWGYREVDGLGGYDPYSNSKACSELVTSSYRNSFFNIMNYSNHGVAVASARAGNVIGGGDWAKDRLIPDCINALLDNKAVIVRNPLAIRPWQHVLEPLSGYLLLAQKLYEEGPAFAESWNFGPLDSDAKPVKWIVQKMCEKWDGEANYLVDGCNKKPHEANFLKLDCSKAHTKLDWHPKWSLDKALDKILEWASAYRDGKNLFDISISQIEEYSK